MEYLNSSALSTVLKNAGMLSSKKLPLRVTKSQMKGCIQIRAKQSVRCDTLCTIELVKCGAAGSA
jgi:hypothetical protein